MQCCLTHEVFTELGPIAVAYKYGGINYEELLVETVSYELVRLSTIYCLPKQNGVRKLVRITLTPNTHTPQLFFHLFSNIIHCGIQSVFPIFRCITQQIQQFTTDVTAQISNNVIEVQVDNLSHFPYELQQ